MFKANIEEKNDHLLVKLIGDLDVYSKEDFSKFCDESLKNTDTDFIIDLEKLDYICLLYTSNRDHTTVMHGHDKIKDLMEEDQNFRQEIEEIIKEIKA